MAKRTRRGSSRRTALAAVLALPVIAAGACLHEFQQAVIPRSTASAVRASPSPRASSTTSSALEASLARR